VAHALKRPPQYTTKWFGAELGAQSTYTNKEGEGERAIVNGHHDTPIFQTMLDKFIQKYVLCENCHLPEIDMFVKKGVILAKCAACGWAGELDNNHKLAAYISKNPPDASGHGVVNLAVAAGTGEKKSKEDRQKDREEKRKAKGAEGGDDDDDEDAPKKERKEKKEKKEKSGTKEKKEKKLNADGEEETAEEKEARRAKRRAEKAENGGEKKEKREKKEKSGTKEKKERKEKPAKKEESDDDDSGDNKADNDEDVEFDSEIVVSVIGVMREFIQTKNGAVKPADFFEELRMQQLAKLFDHKVRFYITLEALFPNGAMDAKAVADQTKVINEVLSMVKIPTAHVLWSFNAYLSLEANEKAVRSYPMVLKTIYDEEWASEEDLLKYYTQEDGAGEPGFEKANTAAAPFLKWLQTAEESDEDEEDESSEEDN